jgi:hypothetical protein
VELLTERDAREPERPPIDFHGERSAFDFLTHLVCDPGSMATLRRVAADDARCASLSGLRDHDVLRYLASRLVSGRIKVIPALARQVSGAATEAEDSKAARPGSRLAVDATHWIEIEVVDDSGKGVPDIEYRLVCPDGDVRWGTTGKAGYARETGLPAGTCKVSFPGIDRTTLGPA